MKNFTKLVLGCLTVALLLPAAGRCQETEEWLFQPSGSLAAKIVAAGDHRPAQFEAIVAYCESLGFEAHNSYGGFGFLRKLSTVDPTVKASVEGAYEQYKVLDKELSALVEGLKNGSSGDRAAQAVMLQCRLRWLFICSCRISVVHDFKAGFEAPPVAISQGAIGGYKPEEGTSNSAYRADEGGPTTGDIALR